MNRIRRLVMRCTTCARRTTAADRTCRACRATFDLQRAERATLPPDLSLVKVQIVCERLDAPRTEVSSPVMLAELFRKMFDVHDREVFVAFFLDARQRLTGVHVVSIGSLNASIVHPREGFKAAIAHNAAGIAFAHNHPSGDPEPSPEDVAVTRRLRQAGELLGIEVVDHVVVTATGFVSLKVRGNL